MIRCVPKTYGFAHVCDGCGASGPIVGDSPVLLDTDEMRKIGVTTCEGQRNGCSALAAGWLVGERDLCPACRGTLPSR